MNSETVFFPLLLTTKTCAVSLFLFLFLAVPLSYWLAGRKSIFAKAVELLITLPLVFPPIALGYMLLVVLGRNGLVGILLENLGLRMVFSQTGVILAAFIAGLPLVVKPLQAAFDCQEAKELEEAARVCGLNKLKTFFFISIPLCSKILLAGLLLGLARASGEVGITMMLGGNISGRTNTLSLEIFNSVSRGDFDCAAFLCTILAVFAGLIYAALYFLQPKRI